MGGQVAETPNTVHGRLLEAVHISGYSMERACSELDWLLDEDRWKSVGNGFEDINDFLATIDLSEFKIAVEQRKKLAKRLKAIEASQRATAKALGVTETTVARDLGKPRGATNVANKEVPAPETGGNNDDGATFVAPEPPAWFQDDSVDPANLAKKQEARNRRESDKAQRDDSLANVSTVWPDGKYPVLYADPPWRYEHPPIGSSSRSIENHYPTMELSQICALPVKEIAADSAVLFLWATAPKLAETIEVLTWWDFQYRTCMVWVKDKIGMGYHARNQHEILLIAKRGTLPPPEPSDRPSSVVNAPRGAHSAKPEIFYELIERMYPGLPKIELFARSQRDGWAAWGNQANAA